MTNNRLQRNARLLSNLRWKALLVILLGMLSACSTDDTYLPALLADPMAEYEAEGIELTYRDTAGYVKTDVLGNSNPARVTSRYRILDQSDSEGVLEEAVAEAETHGWELEQGTGPTAMVGSKDLGVGEGWLLLSIVPSDPEDTGSPEALAVSLSFSSYDQGP